MHRTNQNTPQTEPNAPTNGKHKSFFFQPFALMTTAYPFHECVLAELLPRTGPVNLLIGMICCGVVSFRASVIYNASCRVESCRRPRFLIKSAYLSNTIMSLNIWVFCCSTCWLAIRNANNHLALEHEMNCRMRLHMWKYNLAY